MCGGDMLDYNARRGEFHRKKINLSFSLLSQHILWISLAGFLIGEKQYLSLFGEFYPTFI